MIPLEKIERLPLYHRETIPQEYIDLMGHMNVQWYMKLYSDAVWTFFASFGMDEDYYNRAQAGGFALVHHLTYYAEVHAGETVAVYSRMLGRNEKRIHFISYIVNETTRKLASSLEALGTHANMRIRKTSPYPQDIAALIDEKIEKDSQLDWDPKLCGCIGL